MSDAAQLDAVAKRLEEGILESGELRLGPKESARLGLPPHSHEIECSHEGEVFAVAWRGSDRTLGGERFAEAIQLYGQVGGVVWLHPRTAGIELQFVEPGTSTVLSSRWERRVHTPMRTPSTPRRPQRRRTSRQLREERFRIRDASEYDWYDAVGVHKPTLDRFCADIEAGDWDSQEQFDLRLRGERLATVNDFEELLAVDLAKVDHMPHQEQTAAKVLASMRGRAILADEVGLGKTIEAGLIMKELAVRGLVHRTLVLCPATLREQWRDELHEKFDESFRIVSTGHQPMDGDRLIMSHALARRNIDRLGAEPWDLVVVDEAHKLSGANAKKSHELLEKLESRYRLFLTATPVQNDLLELYRLVELLRPGTFRSESDFRSRYMAGKDKRTPRDPSALRRLVSDVMVRTTREQAGIDKIARYAVDVPITLSAAERQVYELCTDVLRHVMTEGIDSLRRRHLAQRLTTSPRALAISAKKVASTHPNPRAVEALTELAELCRDFPLTNRQHELMRLVKEWVTDPEKGKVLVFTQTYETLHDLMRVLAEHGVDSEAYHGGLTARARQAAIARFRDDCPVLLSTDAGAEGLNLQFANCVVNYDLPWNPMRIEQRIGRVHRVTQTRDVHVANFYARNTVDQHVYRLLHDKLRMFELLFGQVTTILGELDDKGDATTFEGKVFDAYLAADDDEMTRRLDALGQKVDRAYRSAQEMTASGSHINTWMVDRSYRSGIKGQATELLPDVELRARRRQREVESFVADYLSAVGGTVAHRADDGSFLMADIPDELGDEMGGRHQLLLAFSPAGLDHHQDAELCAVGSDVFEEIVASLRGKGDLLARVPRTPQLDPSPWLAASDGVEFVSREITGPARWAARANWRVHTGESAADDFIVQTDLGDVDEFETAEHRTLDGAEALPFSAGKTDELLAWVVEGSVGDIEGHRAVAQEATNQAAAADRDRQVAHLDTRIAEREERLTAATPDVKVAAKREIEKLRAARKTLRQQRAAGIEMRAEMMSLRLTGQRTLCFLETWRNRGGVEGQLEYEWDPWGDPEPEAYGDDDRLVTTVQVCRDSHAVDASHSRDCPRCSETVCDACGDDSEMRSCVICEQTACVRCVSGTPLVCRDCAEPRRRPHADRDGMVAWELGHGRVLAIGEGVAFLDDEVIMSAQRASSSVGRRVRAAARARGLRLDMGVGSDPRPQPFHPSDDALAVRRQDEDDWRIDPAGGSDIDTRVARRLPDSPGEAGDLAQAHTATISLITRLRAQAPPAPAPRLIQVPIQVTTWIELSEGALWSVERIARGDLEPTVSREPIRWEIASAVEGHDLVAMAPSELGDIALHRLHRSYMLTIGDTHSWFVGVDQQVDESAERIADELRQRLGLPHGTVIRLAPQTPMPTAVPEPADVRCTDLNVDSEWHVVDGQPPSDYITRHDVDTFEWTPIVTGRRRPERLERPLRSLVSTLDSSVPHSAVTVDRTVVVTATWQGRAAATRRFEVVSGNPAWPILDDTGVASDRFGIDDLGHLHRLGHDWRCPACTRWRCGGCGEGGVLAPCDTCGQEACGDCRAAECRSVATAQCGRCGTRSCGDCGREVQVEQCVLCLRDVCSSCWSGGACDTCADMQPASQQEIAGLPRQLVAEGLDVVLGHDVTATVVGLAGATRRELAVVTAGRVTRWLTLMRQDELALRTRLAYGAAAGIGDLGLHIDRTESLAPTLPDDRLLLRSDDSLSVSWGLDTGDGVGSDRLSDPVPLAGSSDADALAAVLDSCGGGLLVPEPPPDAAVSRSLDRLAPRVDRETAPATLHVRLRRSGQHIELRADGLRTVDFVGLSVNTTVTSWRAGHGNVDMTAGSLAAMPPHAARHAQVDDVEATLLELGAHVLLLLRVRGAEHWCRVDDSPGFPESIDLGSALGLPGPVAVGRLTLPSAAVPVTVANATLEHRDVSAITSPSAADPDPTNLHHASTYWTAAAPRVLANIAWGDLPAQLRWALCEGAGITSNATIDVGVRYRDLWATPAGRVELSYDIAGGTTEGMVVTHDTQVEANTVTADRSGHMVANASECAYCRTLTCNRCDQSAKSCALCAVIVCGRCCPQGDHVGLCPACRQLTRLGWRDRRRHKALVRGTDGHRTVSVAPATGDNEREARLATVKVEQFGDVSQTNIALEPAVVEWLNSIVGKAVF